VLWAKAVLGDLTCCDSEKAPSLNVITHEAKFYFRGKMNIGERSILTNQGIKACVFSFDWRWQQLRWYKYSQENE